MTQCRLASPVVHLIIAIGIVAPAFAIAAKFVARISRPGVKQPFLLVEPDSSPVASVILFPGGNGKIKPWKRDPEQYGGNFLVLLAPNSRCPPIQGKTK